MGLPSNGKPMAIQAICNTRINPNDDADKEIAAAPSGPNLTLGARA